MPFIKLQNTIVNTDNILYATIIETNSFDKNLLIKFKQQVELGAIFSNILNFEHFKVPDLLLKYTSTFQIQGDLEKILASLRQ